MLRVEGIDAGYGSSLAVRGLSLEVPPGRVLALLGRNGAGKSTALKTIAGLLAPVRGRISFENAPIAGLPAHAVNRRGIAYVPEERRVFNDLTVAEHVAIAGRRGGWSTERIFALFPALRALRARRGRALSGGEQQMLAIGRALATGPRLLLLDEPSQGLAPAVVDALLASIAQLRGEGLAVILVEQNVGVALDVADMAIVIDRGATVFTGTSAQLRARPDVASAYLGVGSL